VFEPGEIDWAQIHKIYKSQAVAPGRYSPPACIGTKIKVRLGDPDPSRISTSYVERQNLTMRMGMRRFTRLTNGFSKKVEDLAHAVSLHYMYYKLRPHPPNAPNDARDGRRRRRPQVEPSRDRRAPRFKLMHYP
jgi:hypothetical protein